MKHVKRNIKSGSAAHIRNDVRRVALWGNVAFPKLTHGEKKKTSQFSSHLKQNVPILLKWFNAYKQTNLKYFLKMQSFFWLFICWFSPNKLKMCSTVGWNPVLNNKIIISNKNILNNVQRTGHSSAVTVWLLIGFESHWVSIQAV